jgi:hypothetical protein
MTTSASTASFTPRSHLRAEVARLLAELGALVSAQRARGRSAAGDALAGLVIEDGEAEGLLRQLAEDFDAAESGAHRRDEARFLLLERARAASKSDRPLPLLRALAAFDLSDAEYDALVLAAAVEMDGRIGRLIAYLNDHAGRPRPTLGLVLSLSDASEEKSSPLAFSERAAVRDGLLLMEGTGPLPTRELRIDARMAARLWGENEPHTHDLKLHPVGRVQLDTLVLHDGARAALRNWGEELRAPRPVRTLAVVGPSGSGRLTAARAALALGGRSLVTLDLEHRAGETAEALGERLRRARCEARWHDSALLLRAPEDTSNEVDWRLVWESLDDLPLPLLIALSAAELSRATMAAPGEPLVVTMPEYGVGDRVVLWRALLPAGAQVDDGDITSLASRFQFGPGRITRVVQRAEASLHARPRGSRRLDLASLETAARAIGAATMGALAERLALPYTEEQLIVPERITRELALAVSWIRHAREVMDEWGFGERLGTGRGLTALLSGPPGTGKTMAAQVLARQLGLELFRVDLSRTVSKYIGETEKNLGRIFDEARASGAAILFDEADALFGRRSEVKDAHDRYANVEIGYLLQRLEAHDGVTILATNRARDLDEAFVRRFHVMIDFPLPSSSDRVRIWEGMLPRAAARDADVDLATLAQLVELSGGEIKNAALAAAYLAAAERSSIGMRHLRRAVSRELTKNGRVMGTEIQRELER